MNKAILIYGIILTGLVSGISCGNAAVESPQASAQTTLMGFQSPPPAFTKAVTLTRSRIARKMYDAKYVRKNILTDVKGFRNKVINFRKATGIKDLIQTWRFKSQTNPKIDMVPGCDENGICLKTDNQKKQRKAALEDLGNFVEKFGDVINYISVSNEVAIGAGKLPPALWRPALVFYSEMAKVIKDAAMKEGIKTQVISPGINYFKDWGNSNASPVIAFEKEIIAWAKADKNVDGIDVHLHVTSIEEAKLFIKNIESEIGPPSQDRNRGRVRDRGRGRGNDGGRTEKLYIIALEASQAPYAWVKNSGWIAKTCDKKASRCVEHRKNIKRIMPDLSQDKIDEYSKNYIVLAAASSNCEKIIGDVEKRRMVCGLFMKGNNDDSRRMTYIQWKELLDPVYNDLKKRGNFFEKLRQISEASGLRGVCVHFTQFNNPQFDWVAVFLDKMVQNRPNGEPQVYERLLKDIQDGWN